MVVLLTQQQCAIPKDKILISTRKLGLVGVQQTGCFAILGSKQALKLAKNVSPTVSLLL